MRQGEKIRMIIEETGEERYYLVDRVYGSEMILRVINQEEAGDGPILVRVKRLRHAEVRD